MRADLVRKWSVVPVILLFIGVALTPCIQSKALVSSTQNERVEINIDALGIPGMKSQTMRLSEEQIQSLECILAGVDQKLNQAATTEEARAIFEDAVEQLHAFGLFGTLSVQQAKSLLAGRSHNEDWKHLRDKRINSIFEKSDRTNEEEYLNRYCFIFYHLKSSSDSVLSLFLPVWMEYLLSDPIDDFATFFLFRVFFGVLHFMTDGMVLGSGFQIKTFGAYGPVTIDPQNNGSVNIKRFTGLRLQYHLVRPSDPMLPFFEKGFLIGYANSIS